MKRSIVRLNVDTPNTPPPSEFRLFVSGWNDTEHGKFLFDDEAAKAVMSSFSAHAVDRMIDLEHLSLHEDSPAFDPDARGWCKLELRADGSLWAVDVKWTKDGASRLSDKRQRYISPAFETDKKTKRVTKIVNIALTALPATHGTPELVAASARVARDLRKLSTGTSMNEVQRAIQAALSDLYPSDPNAPCMGPWVCDVFDASAVYEHDGKLFEVTYTLDGSTAKLGSATEVKRTYAPVTSALAPTQTSTRAKKRGAVQRLTAGVNMDAKQVQQALDALIADDKDKGMEILKGMLAANAAAGSSATPAPAAASATPAPPAKEETTLADGGEGGEGEGAEEEDEDEKVMAAASSRLQRLTGRKSITDSLEQVEIWRKSHLALEESNARIAKEQEALELSKRKDNAAKLVQLGAETPATSGLAVGKLVKRLLDEPIDEQDKRVAALLAARGGKLPAPIKAPIKASKANAPEETHDLSEHELAECKAKKVDPAKYAATRAAIRARSATSNRAEA